ncbi:MAG: DUF2275 domain-containing protein [Smithellaceae bacterium]
MRKCRDIESLLPLYAEGILSDDEMQAVEKHLADCGECRREMARLEKAGHLVNNLSPVEDPAWFQQKIMARVREEVGKKSFWQKWFYPLRVRIPVQIAATIVIAVLAVFIYRSGDDQVQQILPGAPKPAMKAQIQQAPAPAPMPQVGEVVLPTVPRKKSAVPEKGVKGKQAVISTAIGGSIRESEMPEIKSDKVQAKDDGRPGAFDEAKETSPTVQLEQNKLQSVPLQAADSEKSAKGRALPAMERKKEADKMAAPSATRSMPAPAALQTQARIFVQVDDLNDAAAEVDRILAQHNANKVTKHLEEGRIVVRAEVSGKDWKEVLSQLKGIGAVEEKVKPADVGFRSINVVIEISGR